MMEATRETCFAPAPRAPYELIKVQVERVQRDPVVSAVIAGSSGLLAVLNEQRQVLMVNDALLSALGMADKGAVLGLRPGEALRCTHAGERQAGCGTGPHCNSCGAVLAILAAQATERPAQERCVVTSEFDGREETRCFTARAVPLAVQGLKLTLLWLEDISRAEQRAALESVFFHDLRNIASALLSTAEVLKSANLDERERREFADSVYRLTERLCREIDLQRVLGRGQDAQMILTRRRVRVRNILRELYESVGTHSQAHHVELRVEPPPAELTLTTDPTVLQRVLTNMVLNACEASGTRGTVSTWVERTTDGVVFCVWNRQTIPPEIADRIFQCYFTTKNGPGRGLGTYSMKVLGESLLRGRVSFTTSVEEGTTFRLWHPLASGDVATDVCFA